MAILDSDPEKLGQRLRHLTIEPMLKMKQVTKRENVAMAIVAVPSSAAQTVVDMLVEAGIQKILNFAPCSVYIPENVSLRSVDLSVEMEQLAVMHRERLVLSE